MVAIVTVLPNLSVDFSVLRAFQEALILIGPLIVVGSVTFFWPLRGAWALRAAATVCVIIFFSTTGLMPQILGGYPAQLSLNNSGQYYDIFYMHPQEVAAVDWLAVQSGVLRDGVQAAQQSDRFAFISPSGMSDEEYITDISPSFIGDIYPTLIRTSSWVILSYTTVHIGQATADVDGDLVTYRYPTGFLEASKDLVYSNGGAQIYR
jgi:hypothetical protein